LPSAFHSASMRMAVWITHAVMRRMKPLASATGMNPSVA